MGIIRAFRTLDCARKVRIHYLLPEPLSGPLLERVVEANITRKEFSRMVAGAKDHLSYTHERPQWHAAGVDGENKLVVTFGKLGEESAEGEIGRFERRLSAACGASIEEHRPPGEPSTARRAS